MSLVFLFCFFFVINFCCQWCLLLPVFVVISVVFIWCYWGCCFYSWCQWIVSTCCECCVNLMMLFYFMQLSCCQWPVWAHPPVVLNWSCCICYWIIWPHSPLTGCVVWCMLLMSLLFLFVLCVVGFQCCACYRPAHLGPLSTCCVVWKWWCCFNCCCVVDLNIWVLR